MVISDTSISNGDNIRNRSPLVRFTITNPETQQVGTVSQTSVNSSPPDTQTNSPTSKFFCLFSCIIKIL